MRDVEYYKKKAVEGGAKQGEFVVELLNGYIPWAFIRQAQKLQFVQTPRCRMKCVTMIFTPDGSSNCCRCPLWPGFPPALCVVFLPTWRFASLLSDEGGRLKLEEFMFNLASNLSPLIISCVSLH